MKLVTVYELAAGAGSGDAGVGAIVVTGVTEGFTVTSGVAVVTGLGIAVGAGRGLACGSRGNHRASRGATG